MLRGKHRVDALAVLGVDMLFVLLPFLVYGIIFAIRNTPAQVLQLPSWSFAASILYGRTIVKFVSVVISKKISTGPERVALIITLLFVLGVVPSLLVVFFMVTTTPPSKILVIIQLLLFIIATSIFLFFGIDLSAENGE